jgi:hypothetical protein
MQDKLKMMEGALEICRRECAAADADIRALLDEPPPRDDDARRARSARFKEATERKAKAAMRMLETDIAIAAAKFEQRH